MFLQRGDFASNKAFVVRKMEEARRKIITAQARLEGQAAGYGDRKQQQMQQIESYLRMATQLAEQEYSEEGTKTLVSIIQKWQSEATQQLQAWMEEEEKG